MKREEFLRALPQLHRPVEDRSFDALLKAVDDADKKRREK